VYELAQVLGEGSHCQGLAGVGPAGDEGAFEETARLDEREETAFSDGREDCLLLEAVEFSAVGVGVIHDTEARAARLTGVGVCVDAEAFLPLEVAGVADLAGDEAVVEVAEVAAEGEDGFEAEALYGRDLGVGAWPFRFGE